MILCALVSNSVVIIRPSQTWIHSLNQSLWQQPLPKWWQHNVLVLLWKSEVLILLYFVIVWNLFSLLALGHLRWHVLPFLLLLCPPSIIAQVVAFNNHQHILAINAIQRQSRTNVIIQKWMIDNCSGHCSGLIFNFARFWCVLWWKLQNQKLHKIKNIARGWLYEDNQTLFDWSTIIGGIRKGTLKLQTLYWFGNWGSFRDI